MCSFEAYAQGTRPFDRNLWQKQIKDMASRGQCVLAIAFKPADASQLELNFSDVEEGLNPSWSAWLD